MCGQTQLQSLELVMSCRVIKSFEGLWKCKCTREEIVWTVKSVIAIAQQYPQNFGYPIHSLKRIVHSLILQENFHLCIECLQRALLHQYRDRDARVLRYTESERKKTPQWEWQRVWSQTHWIWRGWIRIGVSYIYESCKWSWRICFGYNELSKSKTS